MKQIKNFLRGLAATLIVMIGVFLFNFYMTHSFGIVTLICGTCGFLLLYPAVKKWEERLSNDDANQN